MDWLPGLPVTLCYLSYPKHDEGTTHEGSVISDQSGREDMEV